jgi:hypothetical protein
MHIDQLDELNLRRSILLAYLAMTLLLPGNSLAVTYVRPTIPGTNADSLVKPGMAVDGDRIYQTLPGSDAEDLTKPGYVREGNTWVQTLPSTPARKAKGHNYNVYGTGGKMVVPAPIEDEDDDDRESRVLFGSLPTPCPPAVVEIGDC